MVFRFVHQRRTIWEAELAEKLEGRRTSLVEIEELERKLLSQSHYHGLVSPSRLLKRQ
jgi:hypothetical protein